RAVPRTQAVHDSRCRPMVGYRDPTDDQVSEPAFDDVGVVAQAATGKPSALHADPGIQQGDLCVGLAGAQDAPGHSGGPCAESARTCWTTISITTQTNSSSWDADLRSTECNSGSTDGSLRTAQ